MTNWRKGTWGQDAIDEVRGCVVHTSRVARWTEAAGLVGEGDEAVETAVSTPDADEAVAEQATFEISLEGVFNASRVAESVFTAFGGLRKRLREMSAHSFMQHAVLGLSALVLPGEWRKRRTWVALILMCGGGRGHPAAALHRACQFGKVMMARPCSAETPMFVRLLGRMGGYRTRAVRWAGLGEPGETGRLSWPTELRTA